MWGSRSPFNAPDQDALNALLMSEIPREALALLPEREQVFGGMPRRGLRHARVHVGRATDEDPAPPGQPETLGVIRMAPASFDGLRPPHASPPVRKGRSSAPRSGAGPAVAAAELARRADTRSPRSDEQAPCANRLPASGAASDPASSIPPLVRVWAVTPKGGPSGRDRWVGRGRLATRTRIHPRSAASRGRPFRRPHAQLHLPGTLRCDAAVVAKKAPSPRLWPEP